MTEHVLIIEDESRIAALLADYLQHAGYRTSIAPSGKAGLKMADEADLVLLDLMLPDMDGLEVCRQLRERSDIPVLMITARVEEADKLLGLDAGADDYICKPFSPREVVARVRSALRRAAGLVITGRDTLPQLHPERLEVHFQGRQTNLTLVEFSLFQALIDRPGVILSRDQLMGHIYDDHRIVNDRTVDSHIKKLRRKLADAFPEMEFIHSVYGAGYRFQQINKSAPLE